MRLWPSSGAPVLRGATIAQRRRRQAVDGETFGGGRAVLPAYSAREFEALAKAGANLVVMSWPELWTVQRPWKRDNAVADMMLAQMDAARAAGLFVVLGLRSGPGRSDFAFHRDGAGDWFPRALIDDSIWRDRQAQDAWGRMCAGAAKLIANRPEAAGLILMVEPDNNHFAPAEGRAYLGAHDPAHYLREVKPLFDLKRMSSEWARAVRAAAPELPILISPPGYARTDFLSVMGAPPVAGTVWCVHDYEPRDYTHTSGGERGLLPYPGNDATFAKRLDAATKQGAPVFLGEFGATRHALGRAAFHRDRIAICEARGAAWSIFRWPTFDTAYEAADPAFDVTVKDRRWYGDDGDDSDETLDVLRASWMRNTTRPSLLRRRSNG